MKKSILLVIAAIMLILQACSVQNMPTDTTQPQQVDPSKPSLKILASSELNALEPIFQQFTKESGIQIVPVYKGSVDSMLILEQTPGDYDSVWLSNSQWIAMGDKNKKVKNQKSIMTSPVVWGIKKSVAEKLGFVGKPVKTSQILDAVRQKKLSFAMTSASQSNSGASAYIGFLYAAMGNPQMITSADLHRPETISYVKDLLGGVNRNSASSSYLKDLFLGGDYDAMINYEALIIDTNKELIAQGKEPLYLVYPDDGLTVADYSLGYINNDSTDKDANFKKFQDYLLTDAVQKQILNLGRRTGFGGVVTGADPAVFNPNWGIDINKVLSPITFPEPAVIMEALNLYQTTFKKPSYTVFLIDYSGSMAQNGGEAQVKDAMGLLLDQNKASQFLLQSSQSDVIEVIPFNSGTIDHWKAEGVENFGQVLDKIKKLNADGGTNFYDPANEGLKVLSKVDPHKYTRSIVLMTDGQSKGSLDSFQSTYKSIEMDIPVFTIPFGSELDEGQLKNISKVSRGKYLPSKNGLADSFKQARGYN